MQKAFYELLSQWNSFPATRLQTFATDGEHIIEGIIQTKNKEWIPIQRGVPCFLNGDLQPDWTEFAAKHNLPIKLTSASAAKSDQSLTTVTFSDKWSKFTNYGMEDEHKDFLFGWYCKKLGVDGIEELKQFYGDKKTILEVGPGSGFNTRFMSEHCAGYVVSADISDAAFTTFENTRDLSNCHVIQSDLMDLPLPDNHFDFVIADGVLHHTPDTQAAVQALYQKVKPGGQFFFYVYKKMGAARYFCDQHIRQSFSKLTPEECYKACEGITDLGRELSKLNATVTLDKPIPILGIPAGTHNLQRLVYYNFLKCFWNDAFDYETNNMVNYDWYHPHNAWQHTEDEVTDWLARLGVEEYKFHEANPNGVSVLLRKPVAVVERKAG